MAEHFAEHQAEIGHYFRSLYNIIKFVDRSSVADPRLYTNLVRAQLSSFELSLLFYHCLSDIGKGKFKPLVEKYALLKTVPTDKLMRQEDCVLYSAEAFSGRLMLDARLGENPGPGEQA